MSNPYTLLARQLTASLGDNQRTALARDPRGHLEAMGIRVRPEEEVPASELCACDGAFFERPVPNIAYAPTPGSRRELFTMVHEFAHYLIRRHPDILSALHDLDEDAGRIAEGRVCHAFAGHILVPDQDIGRILGGWSPEARHLRELFTASAGSLEACAVRLAEYLPTNGYLVIADPTERRIRFASPSPTAPYQWGRHTPCPTSTRCGGPTPPAPSVGKARSSGRRGRG